MLQSVEQIGNRADRLRIQSDIYLYSSNDVEVPSIFLCLLFYMNFGDNVTYCYKKVCFA